MNRRKDGRSSPHDFVLALSLVFLLLSGQTCVLQAEGDDKSVSLDLTGHLKFQLLGATVPEDNIFRDSLGSDTKDLNLDFRLNFSAVGKHFDFKADAQLIGVYGDTIEFSRILATDQVGSVGLLTAGGLTNDDRRLFDLTSVNSDSGRFGALNRFDRLSVGYTGKKGVLRLGRQAVSWGNGFAYSPMDIFNPFDPTAVDKEYKTGDDMLYGQILRSSGDDVQTVVVFRRDLVTGDVASDQSSAAVKYHGLLGPGEYDLLIGEHYGDSLLGFGGNRSIGGAVWRGDLLLAHTDQDTFASVVSSVSYSWMTGGKNTSGLFEYFYNGFGQPGERYSPQDLAANQELLARVARGELFNVGRHYLAISATVELTPLFLLTPNLFVNIADPSALLQIVAQNDLAQDLVLQTALAIPIGGSGTEFGGVEVEPGRYLSSGASIFLQLAWYF